MSQICGLFVFLMCYTLSLGQDNNVEPGLPVNEVHYRFLKYENTPTVQYKYIVKKLMPLQGQWWKRGTHQIYDKSPADIVEP